MKISTIPNLLSLTRIALAPAMLALAWSGRPKPFLACLAISLLSDAADGPIARRLGEASEVGARLDSWGDFTTYMTVPLAARWLWPDLLRREESFVIAVVVSYLVPVTFGFLKYGRLTSYHTWGAKASAVVLGPGAFLLLAGGPSWPFRVATAVLVVSALEEVAITATLPRWQANVPTLRQALRSVRHPAAVSPAGPTEKAAS